MIDALRRAPRQDVGYDWPSNVRQLENVCHCLGGALVCGGREGVVRV